MDIFQKNLDALKNINPSLSEKISSIETNERYEVFQGKDSKAINILDSKTHEFLYINPTQDIKNFHKDFSLYKEYSYLYFFGIGNGELINYLLSNPKLERLVIIEPELEIFYIAFNVIDFSESFKQRKLIPLLSNQVTFSQSSALFDYKNSKVYARSFELISSNSYYAIQYSQMWEEANATLVKALEQRVLMSGNSITDTMLGIKNQFKHLRNITKKPTFQSLVKNTDTAIIISTGPSLHKQLPLLKSIQDHATLISVDASLPILESYGIIPDIATSIERVELTAEFFKKLSPKFKEKIIFISPTVQHPITVKELSRYTMIPVLRPFDYNYYLDIKPYGYVGYGLSAANLAHELAYLMKFKYIVLIGQDLSYSSEGLTHSKGHIFGQNDKHTDKDIEIPAYGNKGFVKSTMIWQIFLNSISENAQKYINLAPTINATEGGAHIPGTIEMPFKDLIDKYINTAHRKSKIVPTYLDSKEKLKIDHHIDQKLFSIIHEGETLYADFENYLLVLMEKTQLFEMKNEEELFHILCDSDIVELLDFIENFRNAISTNPIFKNFFTHILHPNLLHMEMLLAQISIIPIDNAIDNKRKAVSWILNHRIWLFTLAGILRNTLDVIIEESKER